MTNVRVPTVRDLGTIVLAGLRDMGGTATTAQIRRALDASAAITAEQLAVAHGAGPGTEVHYRTRWALVELRRKGLIERVGPGSWALTDAGAERDRRPAP